MSVPVLRIILGTFAVLVNALVLFLFGATAYAMWPDELSLQIVFGFMVLIAVCAVITGSGKPDDHRGMIGSFVMLLQGIAGVRG